MISLVPSSNNESDIDQQKYKVHHPEESIVYGHRRENLESGKIKFS
jgi:hypothetical protein